MIILKVLHYNIEGDGRKIVLIIISKRQNEESLNLYDSIVLIVLIYFGLLFLHVDKKVLLVLIFELLEA